MHLKKSRHFLLVIIIMGLGLSFIVASDIISPEKTTNEHTATEVSDTDQIIPLIYHMSFMSRYTQKLYFAGEAENWELADLYSHEIEEIGQNLAEKGYVYHDIDVGELVTQMMLPQIEKLEDAIDAQDPRLFAENYRILIDSCNSCHVASDYSIIKVDIPEDNPYAQDFSVQE